jgi:heme exporter protein B
MLYWKLARSVLLREITLRYRKQGEWFNSILFFVVIVSIFPFSAAPNPELLHQFGPGIIWVAAVLSVLLSMHHLFRDDYLDGSLQDIILGPFPLSIVVFFKVIGQWLIFSAPLFLVSPLLALLFHLSPKAIGVLMTTLLLGTLILNFLGAVISALTVSLRNSSLLTILILLPLYVPILIFATNAVMSMENGVSYTAPLILLLAFCIITLCFTPIVIAFSLRIGLDP